MQKMILIDATEYDDLIKQGNKPPIALETTNQVIEQPINQQALCQFLGITEPTIIRYRKRGKIPYLQIGSRILYQKDKVIAALENKKRG
ncbi:Helix-turn-helix domain-containing protein [Mucilaginibacter mallensis]|uniref:Helix-turn-helix domain-containing protein n=1 Tax=Mucilaginibacter mallensis TaxID=652787 RepID=A0A1H1VCF5_MUCMA|nr:helix-turn-helix domain-containing protein [Mucilaginibacter mallensis]SDS82363.1 Helix-turn-helix domain-containing protein [Mucilaginibacter mallensis]